VRGEQHYLGTFIVAIAILPGGWDYLHCIQKRTEVQEEAEINLKSHS
jgi:hypothetical protein